MTFIVVGIVVTEYDHIFYYYSLMAESHKMKNQLKNLEKKINDLKVMSLS